MTLTLIFDLLIKNGEKTLTLAITFALFDPEPSNLACVFLVARPFQPYQNIWPCDLDIDPWPTFVKKLKLPITHEPVIVQLSYFTHMILSMSPFNWYHHLPPNDLDLDIWPTYQKWGKNLNLGYNICIVWPRTFKLSMCPPCGKTFPTIPKYLTLWPWPLTYFCKKNLNCL